MSFSWHFTTETESAFLQAQASGQFENISTHTRIFNSLFVKFQKVPEGEDVLILLSILVFPGCAADRLDIMHNISLYRM